MNANKMKIGALWMALAVVCLAGCELSSAQYDEICHYECSNVYCDPYTDFCDYECYEVCYPYRVQVTSRLAPQKVLGLRSSVNKPQRPSPTSLYRGASEPRVVPSANGGRTGKNLR